MKNNLFIAFLISVFILLSCQKDSGVDLSGTWVDNSNGLISLHTRPNIYTHSKSPSLNQINEIIDNQNNFISIINNKLKLNFKKVVNIYLFNEDEALEKIGTNTGGRALTNISHIYYTFTDYYSFYQNYNVSDYLGLHEMVHIISFAELGKSGTLLMTEGYAVAIDGTYGCYRNSQGMYVRKLNEEWVKEFKLSNQLLSPSELLLGNQSFNEAKYYPQAGYFINWLFNKIGVSNVNKLFTVNQSNFKNEFFRITGKSFDTIEKEYLDYIKTL